MMSNEDNDELICPITQEVFHDPVRAEDGYLYERAAITRWIKEHGTSPFTRQALDINHLQADDQVRTRAEQRRKLSVSYNKDLEQVYLQQIRSSRGSRFTNRVADIEYVRQVTQRNNCCPMTNINTGRCCPSTNYQNCRYRLRNHSNLVICMCTSICVTVPCLVLALVYSTTQGSQSTSTSVYSASSKPSSSCNTFKHTLVANSCTNGFINTTIIDSGTCDTFAYAYKSYAFVAISSSTTIIFAFQQTFGYWDIDNITLRNSNIHQNVFQNGDFESGSLAPNYAQCRSMGNISNIDPFDGRYCYSDRTQGRFGYLMQNLSTSVGTSYYLTFYLQNRNGYHSSFVILLAV